MKIFWFGIVAPKADALDTLQNFLPFPTDKCYLPSVNFHDRITINPDKRSGQPCIRGMRITVKDILEYLAGGMTQQQILEDFPELKPAFPLASLTSKHSKGSPQ